MQYFIALIMQYFVAVLMKDRLRMEVGWGISIIAVTTHIVQKACKHTESSCSRMLSEVQDTVAKKLFFCLSHILYVQSNLVFCHILTTAAQYGSSWKVQRNMCHIKKTRHAMICTHAHTHTTR